VEPGRVSGEDHLRTGGDEPVEEILREATSKPKRPDRSVARENAFPKIEWHHAIFVGLPYGGSLIDGTQLPVEGPSWVTWNPVTDSSPNAPNRLYGNERTIRAIVTVTEAYRAAHPRAARVVIGDISREGGGPMRDEHVSHQNGLDVDVYFPRLDRTLRAPRAPGEIDHRLAQDLLDRFVAAGAQMVFVGYSTGLHGPAGVVVPYPGHEYHMHVRFPRPGA
jgi:murein endopeptidase